MNWEKLANNLLDYLVEYMGISDCVDMLVNHNYTKEELRHLGFEEDTIEDSIARVKSIYESLGVEK